MDVLTQQKDGKHENDEKDEKDRKPKNYEEIKHDKSSYMNQDI